MTDFPRVANLTLLEITFVVTKVSHFVDGTAKFSPTGIRFCLLSLSEAEGLSAVVWHQSSSDSMGGRIEDGWSEYSEVITHQLLVSCELGIVGYYENVSHKIE